MHLKKDLRSPVGILVDQRGHFRRDGLVVDTIRSVGSGWKLELHRHGARSNELEAVEHEGSTIVSSNVLGHRLKARASRTSDSRGHLKGRSLPQGEGSNEKGARELHGIFVEM